MAMNVKVCITDENRNLSYNQMRLYFIDAAIWAVKHCPSYKRFDITDIGDADIECDQVCEYEFTDEKEALMFRLKWL